MFPLVEPTLLLDKQKCLSNIAMMIEKARKNNIIFRPHFKTHQSHEVGRWFRSFGVDKITVSSVKMAEYLPTMAGRILPLPSLQTFMKRTG